MPLLTSLALALALALPSGPAPAHSGVWPLQPRPQVVQGFDPPSSAWGAGHRGVDLAGRQGQAVHTALGGTVVFAARLAGRGVVVVDHGATRTTYEPVDARVRRGQVLVRGAVIGLLQRAGSHCFPSACLHWGLLRGDSYLDPLTLVGAGPVRLLPWWGLAGMPSSTLSRGTPGSLRPSGGPGGMPAGAVLW